MNNKTANPLFISSPLAKYVGFYQDLLRDIGNYRQLGNRLICLAERAHAFRQFDTVSELGRILSNLPINKYKSIGQYYTAVAYNNCGRGDLDKAKSMFELVVDSASDKYKAKALLSLAAVSSHTGDTESQFTFLLESSKASCDLLTKIKSLLGVAVYKGIEGFHRQSLKDLENLQPLTRLCQPVVFYDYLNSLAVELGAVGRKCEARNIIKSVVASPFAFAYPEWRETAEELKGPNRSFVVLNPSPARMGKLLSMPVVEHSEPTKLDRPASVLSLQEWKDKMGKDKNGKSEKFPEDMSGKDMVVKIMNLTTQEGISEKNLRKILDYVRKVLSEPDKD